MWFKTVCSSRGDPVRLTGRENAFLLDDYDPFSRLHTKEKLTSPVSSFECELIGSCFLLTAACDVGWFGEDCSSRCHCHESLPCRQEDGLCPRGCSPGWTGRTCNTGQSLVVHPQSQLQCVVAWHADALKQEVRTQCEDMFQICKRTK